MILLCALCVFHFGRLNPSLCVRQLATMLRSIFVTVVELFRYRDRLLRKPL